MRLALALLLLPLLPGGLHAQDFYAATAIVTGTDDRMRPEGFDRCLRDVLVKVSGAPGLAADPRVSRFEAEAMAEDFAYQDRMSDQVMHDEQGSRDRPYDLTVHFSPPRIDAALRELGETPWTGPRPPLLLLVTVNRNGESYPLTADGAPDERPREAALAAGVKYAMRVVLPAAGGPPPAVPGMATLHGTLAWTPATYGWTGSWRIAANGRDAAWGIEGVSFDEALRDAVRGAMHALR